MRNGVIGSTADSDSVSRGSSPFSVAGNLLMQVPYFIGVWLSLVERYVRDVEVASSNLVTPMVEEITDCNLFFCCIISTCRIYTYTEYMFAQNAICWAQVE